MYGKRENAYFHVEAATGKRENGGKIMVTWSLLRAAKSLYYFKYPRERYHIKTRAFIYS